jgi:hypothetical protein
VDFLNWWKNNKEETDSQLNLFGSSQSLTPHERVDGAIVHKDFQKAIKDSGGSKDAYPQAVKAETRELFDCGVDELYEQTGGKKGNRSTLPKEAQKAYIASEIRATYELNDLDRSDCHHSDSDEHDRQIVATVREAAQETRKWLPW